MNKTKYQQPAVDAVDGVVSESPPPQCKKEEAASQEHNQNQAFKRAGCGNLISTSKFSFTNTNFKLAKQGMKSE